MRIAAIDIGSNSIKLAVAETHKGGFTILRREKEVVRLGAGTLTSGHLSPATVSRAVDCIAAFKAIGEHFKVDKMIALATASVREADNATQFISEVRRKTGITIEILSGVEEARLIGLAVSHATHAEGSSLLNIDIGGGSTELTVMRNGQPIALHSMKIGAVRLTEQYIRKDPIDAKELSNLRNEIMGALDRPARELRSFEWARVTGTSGTILSIGEAINGTKSKVAESALRAESEISIGALEKFNKLAQSMPVENRKKLPGINAQRAEIIVAGSMILWATMRALKIRTLHTCNWSLREGIILDRLAELRNARNSTHPNWETRLVGAEALGRRFQFEERHGRHVAHLAVRLFDDLQRLHGLPEHYRTIVAAGALLHDIGYAIAHASHHKHSLYLILNSELTGFTDAERLMIANIARYHRKTLPKESHPHFNLLSPQDRDIVWKLGGIVRLADALDRSHLSYIKDISTVIRKNAVYLRLVARRVPQHELWAIENKKDMLETALGINLSVRLAI